MTDLTPELQSLVGEPLNAVSFVMDYVELGFNGSYLRCLEPPTVTGSGVLPVTFPGSGSRDALCALIGETVKGIRAVDGGELRISFTNGSVVTVSLSHDGRGAPEALHFHNQATGETQWW